MVYDKEIIGTSVILRSVTQEDARFILDMRLDSKKNTFVHRVDDDLNQEIRWIEAQRERAGDYFFSIISRKNKTQVGTISIYEINQAMNNAELGRWISYGTAVENLECAILAHDFAFDALNLDTVFTKTMQDNVKVVNFWKRFGGEGEDNKDIGEFTVYYNIVSRREFKKNIRNRFAGLLEGKYD